MVKEKILGVDVCILNYDGIISQLNKDIINNDKVFVIAINPEKILKCIENKELMKITNSADYQIADGIGIVLASKLKNGNIKNRITGIDLTFKIMELANVNKYKVYLYGSKKEVVKKAFEFFKEKYPNAILTGYSNGYSESVGDVIKKINKHKPNIILVALGSPKQEKFIYNNKDKINANVYCGVGGTFDVVSGNLNRAPLFMRKLGLEWMYRLIIEPKRIFRQIKIFKFIKILLFKKKKVKVLK